MTQEILDVIAKAMDEIKVNYDYPEWQGKPEYPYFVGEYQESEPINEDGQEETDFMLTGFARGANALLDLERDKAKIKKKFPSIGGMLATTESGSVVAIFYAGTLANIPTGDEELKKIQINLKVKEWTKQ